jgi:cobalt-zinc-cadmium efflux system protein
VLSWSLLATVSFVVIEIVAGVRAHSLALLSDAGHNATDALALLLAWLAVYFQSKPADEVKTFGYQRAGVLAAFVNAITLVVLSIWIFWESYQRLRHPEPVSEITMMVVAGLGILMNGGIMLGLASRRHNDLNVKSAFVHMLGDLLGSFAIVIGAVVIYFTGFLQVDTLLSVLIAALIVWTAWDVIQESLNILLEGLPRGIELKKVVDTLCSVEGVLDVHDLHIWSIGSSSSALSCHVLIEDIPPSASEHLLLKINQKLLDEFHIHHSTVQFEHVQCAVSLNGCVIPMAEHHHHHHH